MCCIVFISIRYDYVECCCCGLLCNPCNCASLKNLRILTSLWIIDIHRRWMAFCHCDQNTITCGDRCRWSRVQCHWSHAGTVHWNVSFSFQLHTLNLMQTLSLLLHADNQWRNMLINPLLSKGFCRCITCWWIDIRRGPSDRNDCLPRRIQQYSAKHLWLYWWHCYWWHR